MWNSPFGGLHSRLFFFLIHQHLPNHLKKKFGRILWFASTNTFLFLLCFYQEVDAAREDLRHGNHRPLRGRTLIRTKLVSRWIRTMSGWWCLVTMVSQKGIVCKEAVSFHLYRFFPGWWNIIFSAKQNVLIEFDGRWFGRLLNILYTTAIIVNVSFACRNWIIVYVLGFRFVYSR